MAIFNDVPELVSNGVSERLATGASASFELRADLFGQNSIDLEEVLVVKVVGRGVFKGVVEEVAHNLEGESVTISCIGVDQYIDSQPWEAANAYYNTQETPCGESLQDVTLEDFFNEEFVGDVADWFSSYVLPNSIKDLLVPAVTTLKKGFMTVLQEILAPYPYVKWVIEFDDAEQIFPVGELVLIDLRAGRSSHAIPVGGATGIVTSMSVQRTAKECAKHIEIHARGRFVERFELLTPDWKFEDERIYSGDTPIFIEGPTGDDGTIKLPPGFDFHYDIWLYAEDIDLTRPQGVGSTARQTRMWPGADYEINMETGEIRFMRPETGESWWWVNDETGVIVPQSFNNYGPFSNLSNTSLRRPVAYNNAHADSDVRYFFFAYYMGEDPYRTYRTSKPIADFRIRQETQEIDGETVTTYRRLPTSFEIFIPKAIAEGRYEIQKRAEESRTFASLTESGITGDFLGSPDSGAQNLWRDAIAQVNNAIAAFNDRQDPELLDPISSPDMRANMLWPRITNLQDVDEKEILRFFSVSSGSASFDEGTTCVRLSERQLMADPLWYDLAKQHAVLGSLTTTDPIEADWYTWPVLARYTSWEDIVEERTTSFGGERYYRGVVNSVFKYEDATNKDSDGTSATVFDNSASLVGVADDSADFFGTPYWTGSVTVLISFNPDTGEWTSPYRVGDTVTFTGGGAPGFLGLINEISYDLENMRVTLGFGRREPRVNPFLPRSDYPVDIEGDSLTGTGKAGLSPLGGSQ